MLVPIKDGSVGLRFPIDVMTDAPTVLVAPTTNVDSCVNRGHHALGLFLVL